MMTHRAIDLGLIAFLTLAAGCFSGSDQSSPQAVATATTQPSPTTAPSVASVADAPSPDILAAKVASFTHDLQPPTAHGEGRKSRESEQAAPASTQPSDDGTVDLSMLTPQAIRFSDYPVEDQPAPSAPRPPAAVATGDANFPMIVPENADQQAAAVPASDVVSPSDELERKLVQHLRDYPKDPEGQLNYELLLFVEGQPVPQMSAMADLRAEDREILSAVMDGLSNFRNVIRADDNVLLEKKARPLLDMADRLRTQAELTIPTVALCTQVQSFGVFKPVDSNRFVAGVESQVIVYCEVQGFQSQLTPDNQWQTRLSQEMTIYTETGQPVWPDKSQAQDVIDLCREQRHDFFIAKLITLPGTLTAGRYVVKVTVTDEQANHVAEATTPLEIVAQPQAIAQ